MRQNLKKRKPTRRGFWFSANFKTGPIILGRKLWPVHRKYEINHVKKVVEIFSPKDKGSGYLVSRHFFGINVVDIENLVYAGEKQSWLILTSPKLKVRGFSKTLQLQALRVTLNTSHLNILPHIKKIMQN